jgi:hypothetical protein
MLAIFRHTVQGRYTGKIYGQDRDVPELQSIQDEYGHPLNEKELPDYQQAD